jgi:hypothetical protein
VDDHSRFFSGTLPTDIKRVTTIEDLLTCHDAVNAVLTGVSYILRSKTGRWSKENQSEVFAIAVGALGKKLCRRYCRSLKRVRRHRITDTKFLTSKNRAGWLCEFAKLETKNWLRSRIRTAQGDERVRSKLSSGVEPAETFTEERDRTRQWSKTLTFDVFQFQFGRGYAPDQDDENPLDPHGLLNMHDGRTVEHQSPDDADSQRIIHLRQVLSELSSDDREFLLGYVDSRYDYSSKRTAAERKRFQRLKSRVKTKMSQTSEN